MHSLNINLADRLLLTSRFLLLVVVILIYSTSYISGSTALVIGFLITLFFKNPLPSLSHKEISLLLKLSVIGIGFGMNLVEIISVGKEGFMFTMSTISATLVLGCLLGYMYKTNKKSAFLISAGSAICGGTAIATIAPIINANEKELSTSLAVVFLLNALALLIFPEIGHFFNLSQSEFGLWAGIAIHDTSSVVGAALSYGDEALRIATSVKLARILWIIPLSFISAFIFRGNRKQIKFPLFILFFIGSALLTTFFNVPTELVTTVTSLSKSTLVVSLLLLGLSLSVEKIRAMGFKSIVLGASLWFFISIGSLLIIMNT